MIRYLAALCVGIGLGMAFGHARSAGEHSAHDRDAAVVRSQLAICEELLASDVQHAHDYLIERCELAAAACATCAEATVSAEQRARSFLQLGTGPRVHR